MSDESSGAIACFCLFIFGIFLGVIIHAGYQGKVVDMLYPVIEHIEKNPQVTQVSFKIQYTLEGPHVTVEGAK